MLGTAYEIGVILLGVAYRSGRGAWRAGRFVFRHLGRHRVVAAAAEAGGGGEAPASDGVSPATVDTVPVVDTEGMPARDVDEVLAERAGRIVTRYGVGFRVHLYFHRATGRVRRILMIDFTELARGQGLEAARALRLRLGQCGGRPSDIHAARWARVELPDAVAAFESPFDPAAIALIDGTLAMARQFVQGGPMPLPAPPEPAPATKGRRASSAIRTPADAVVDAPPKAVPVARPRAGSTTRAQRPARAPARSEAAAGPAPGQQVPAGAEAVAPAERTARQRAARSRSAAAGPDVPVEGVAEPAGPALPDGGLAPASGAAGQAGAALGGTDGSHASVAVTGAVPPGTEPCTIDRSQDLPYSLAGCETRRYARPVFDPDAAVQIYQGILVETGLAPRMHGGTGHTYTSFFADLESQGVYTRHTGNDLERALRVAGAATGDLVELTYHGTKPVGAKAWHKKLWKARVLTPAASS